MQIKTEDGYRSVSSAGVGGAGLGLGIAGTALGLMNGGFNWLNGGNNKCNSNCNETDEVQSTRLIGALRAELGQEKAERYADNVGYGVYKAGVDRAKELVADANANYKALAGEISDLKIKTAVEAQKTNDNFNFMNYKVDTVHKELHNEINCKNDELRAYVDATFVPGELKMPLDKICPEAMRRYNSWTAPTNQAPDTQPVDVNKQ